MTLFLGFAAVNTGNNLVYLVVSAFLSFMWLSGIFSTYNIKRLEVSVALCNEIYAAMPTPVTVTVRNTSSFLPGFLIRVELCQSEVLIPFVGMRGAASALFVTSFPRRGRHPIERARISSVFPFNFFVRFRIVAVEAEAIVFPTPRACSLSLTLPVEAKRLGERELNRLGFEGDVLSVRAYRAGDQLKYIHWKASARVDGFKTKEFSALVHEPLVVDVDAMSIPDMEERLSRAAFFVVRSFKQAIPLVLKIGSKVMGDCKDNLRGTYASKLAMLRELGLYGL